MTAPPNASPMAEELAATCVQVEARGVLRHVRIVPPGTDPAHSLPWATCSEAEVRHHVADAVRLLAPFVDLGLARGRAARSPATPSAEPPGAYLGALADPALWVHAPREVAPVDHDRHDDDDGDPG